MLKSNGIEVIDSSLDSKYLSTSRHYKFILSDSDKFLEYLSRYSYEQLPPYTSALLKGMVVATDLNYSNIPFTKAVSLDIYPLRLSTDIMDEFKENDEDFHNYIKSFFIQKGILYHINYNIVSEDFDGYIKDIDEKKILKNGSKLLVDISDATFNGNGTLVAPSYLKTDAKKLKIEISNLSEEIKINIGDFSSESTFESRNTYSSVANLKSLSLSSKSDDSIAVEISDIFVDISSNTNSPKAQMSSKTSFSDINITSDILNLNASDFNYDIVFSDMDKDALEELRELLSKSKRNNSIGLLGMIKNSTVNMLSKGLKLNIKDFSLKNISINGDDLNGLSVKSTLNVKEDRHLAQKIDYAPLFIAGNLDLDLKFKVSQKIYSKLASIQPIAMFAQGYAKRSGDDLLFDFTLIDGEFKVNGKSLRN